MPTKYRVYSIGIVSKNKDRDSDHILVAPIEVTPFADGELDADLHTVEGSGVDSDGRSYTVGVKIDNSIEAKWLPMTHRRTPPDVRRGERVLLYRYGDSERYYWQSMGMDDDLRTLETVIYSWAADPREYPDVDHTSPNHCYYLEVSTHDKMVTFNTAKSNGEPFSYTFQFNTREGAVVLTDDAGNHFELDSAATKLTLKNKDNSEVRLDKKKVFINGDEQVVIKSGSTEVVHTPEGTWHTTPFFYGVKA